MTHRTLSTGCLVALVALFAFGLAGSSSADEYHLHIYTQEPVNPVYHTSSHSSYYYPPVYQTAPAIPHVPSVHPVHPARGVHSVRYASPRVRYYTPAPVYRTVYYRTPSHPSAGFHYRGKHWSLHIGY